LHNNNIAISQKVDLIGWTIKGDEDLSWIVAAVRFFFSFGQFS
jgi:hypothetical protein